MELDEDVVCLEGPERISHAFLGAYTPSASAALQRPIWVPPTTRVSEHEHVRTRITRYLQQDLLHMLVSDEDDGWVTRWDKVRNEIGPDFGFTFEEDADDFVSESSWKQRLWEGVCMYQGVSGLEMLQPGGVDKWRRRLVAWREKIATLVEEPPRVYYPLSDDMRNNLSLVMAPGSRRRGRQSRGYTYTCPFLIGDLQMARHTEVPWENSYGNLWNVYWNVINRLSKS
ncbi:hypothetical protein EJ08DRAFT_736436 [Tothia fuscella]|uniref:Uncharacterized protein n=1 Tax=Tothia fuscella TaxID=1048955 RepID=A0A9P4NL86_9PEZI|nr:hypothetical protein EJ08DRAFT_736436 [Tothia fuscella]